MVAPACCHTSLIPPLPFARGIAESVQHGGNLVVAVANSHATNDLQRLQRRRGFGCRTRPLHRELRMRTSLPVNYQFKDLFIPISAHDDLFDGGAEDHLLECGRTVITLPAFSKVITNGRVSVSLFRSNQISLSMRAEKSLFACLILSQFFVPPPFQLARRKPIPSVHSVVLFKGLL